MNKSDSHTVKITPLAKGLAVLISAVFMAMGLLSIVTKHYYAQTSKLGGSEITADGIHAVILGIGVIILGLFPMALWAKSGKIAGLWASFCIIMGLAVLIVIPMWLS
jgi:hypothetical protein